MKYPTALFGTIVLLAGMLGGLVSAFLHRLDTVYAVLGIVATIVGFGYALWAIHGVMLKGWSGQESEEGP